MRILMTGGSGSIGTILSKSLLADGHEVWNLTRNPQISQAHSEVHSVRWDGCSISGWGELVSNMDAVINLAGENIGNGRWSENRKVQILSSRVLAGNVITESIQRANPRPKVLIQASATGYYGPREKEAITENSGPGNDFLAEVCKAWEASSQPVEDLNVRRVVIRTGVVLFPGEGALKRMMLPFKLFVGGTLGNGNQGLPWIHPDDEVGAIRFLLDNEKARGVFNLCGPELISSADFGCALSRVMKRPFWLPVPAFALRGLLGEMSTLVLEGQYLVPKRLQELGYQFRFTTVEAALRDLLIRY